MKKWAIAASGTIVVAVLSAWTIHLIGPNTAIWDKEPTALTLEEKLEDAERTAREVAERTGEDTTGALAGAKAAVWISHIVSEDSPQGTYVVVLDGVSHTAHVSGYYVDQQGTRCRNVEHRVQPHPNWIGELNTTMKMCGAWGVEVIND